jgi:hypothetical protein
MQSHTITTVHAPVARQHTETIELVDNGNKCGRCGKNFAGTGNVCKCNRNRSEVDFLLLSRG